MNKSIICITYKIEIYYEAITVAMTYIDINKFYKLT